MDLYSQLGRNQFLPLLSSQWQVACEQVTFFAEQNINVVELPLRAKESLATLQRLRQHFPQLRLVAGTVLTKEQAEAAFQIGVEGIVSPGWSQEVFQWCQKEGVPYFPGVFTATEVQQALAHGCLHLKFFPAAAAGLSYLTALAAPFVSQGVRFMPSGGINRHNYRSFLELPSVFCVSGSDFESVFVRDEGE